MFNNFKEETKKMVVLAKKEMINLKHPYLGSEHLMLSILKSNNNVSNTLKKYGINYKKYYDEVINLVGIGDSKEECILYTPIVKEIFERAIDISSESSAKVSIDNIFVAIIELGEGIALRVLNNLNINLERIYTDFVFKVPKKNKHKKSLLDEVGIEYTSLEYINNFDPVIGRDNEINQIIQVLVRKNKSNPLLIGEAGVGKTAIIEEISRRIVNNKVPNKLKNKRIINLDMSNAVAGTKYRGEFEEKINKIVKEAENDEDIILFIDEIHTIVGAGGAEGAIDASNIFKPALARGKIKCIGATTLDEYKKFIEKDKALERRFKKIIIEEPREEELKNIVYKMKPLYENFHHVCINNNTLELIIKLANKYIKKYKNPDKTIDILDEVCAHANLKENKLMTEYNSLSLKIKDIINDKNNKIMCGDFKSALKYKQKENSILSRINDLELILTTTNYNVVTKKDILAVLKNKVNVPIVELGDKYNKKKIINNLSNKIFGQQTAINELVNGFIYNLESDNVYSVLLTGKSGVGKTFLAKEFAKEISKKVLRIDMAEYSEPHSISKLIGAPAGYVGYEDTNYLFDSIREYPFTIIILDEIEKAHPTILNLFLQILDNNEIKDSKGNIIYFNNAVVLMTTNIDSKKSLGFDGQKNNIELNEYFTNGFINRVDEIINLNDLEKDTIIEIINKSKINDNIDVNDIVNKSNYKEYGARHIKNLIRKESKTKNLKKIYKNYSKN